MEKSIKKQINTIGKVGYVISLILLILSIVATSVISLLTIALAIIPKDTLSVTVSSDVDVEIGGTLLAQASADAADEPDLAGASKAAMELLETAFPSSVEEFEIRATDSGLVVEGAVNGITFNLKSLFWAMFTSIFGSGCLIFVFIALTKLMKELRACDTPFTDGIVAALRLLAASLIPMAVFNSLSSSVWQSFPGFTGEFHFDLDLATLFVIAILCVLVAIFKYGCTLQKESDELI